MDFPESGIHSFIVKIWLEQLVLGEETGELAWHGYITHVPSGQRRYLREIDDVAAFIRSCLETGSARLSGS